MNENLFAPKPKEVAPTLKSPNMEEVIDPIKEKPEGFKLRDVPEWEVRARGTISTSECGGAPNQQSELDDTDKGTLRAA